MTGNPVGWFEIYVQDIERAKNFYESLFETNLHKLTPPFPKIELWAFSADPNHYGATGALVKINCVPSGGNSTLVYFHCQDCGIEESRAIPLGGCIKRSKMAIGEFGFISLIYDTEDNMIGLHSMK